MVKQQELQNVVAQVNKILEDLDKRITALEEAKTPKTTPPAKKPASTKAA